MTAAPDCPRARHAVWPRRLRTAVALATAWSLALGCAQPLPPGPATGTPPVARIDAVLGATQAEMAVARQFYADRRDTPAWTSSDAAHAALALLDSAGDEGLEPGDYGAPALREALERRNPHPAATAGFDAALTLAMLRYVTDLHGGRTRGSVPSYATGTPDVFDAGALLGAALAEHRLATLPADAAPSLAVYGRLRSALREYRDRAARGDTPVGSATGAGQPRGGDAAAAALRRRLAELGDFQPDGWQGGTETAGAELDAALKRFQRRHGLREDGMAGPATLAALDVPLHRRTRQIAMAMERLRWLPRLPDRRLVAINLPSYRLWAFDRAVHAAGPALDMRVIVGRALRSPTPVFIGLMRYVEFNPYWNVPASILRSEIVPRLARDPAYLGRHRMEIVAAGTVTQRVDAATLERLRAGALRVRQRPGPDNALGAVKFGLPNAMNIYLHGTPARELFDAVRRDFSHGCIRVESPAALAGFVLADAAGWTPGAIAAAMAPGPTRVVQLAVPLPVVIFYATAVPETGGAMSFLDDVYGLDAALERRWSRAPLALPAAGGAAAMR